MEWLAFGYFGLFVACFIAATIIPFSSEAIFTAALLSPMDPFLSLLSASLGNWLGGMSSYFIGWIGNIKTITKWLSISESKIAPWQYRAQRWGYWLALLSWLPVIGDVIAVALGVFRVNVFMTSLLMFLSKTLRYSIVMYLIISVFSE